MREGCIVTSPWMLHSLEDGEISGTLLVATLWVAKQASGWASNGQWVPAMNSQTRPRMGNDGQVPTRNCETNSRAGRSGV